MYTRWANVKDSEDDTDMNDENVSILGEKLNNWMMRIFLLGILVLVLMMALIDPITTDQALRQARSTSLGLLTSKFNSSLGTWQSHDFNTTFAQIKQTTKDDLNKLIRLQIDGGVIDFKDEAYDRRYDMRPVEMAQVCCGTTDVASCSEQQCSSSTYISIAIFDHRQDEINLAVADIGTTMLIIALLFIRFVALRCLSLVCVAPA